MVVKPKPTIFRIFTITLHKISNFAPARKIARFVFLLLQIRRGCQFQYFNFIPAICLLIHYLTILHVAIYVLVASFAHDAYYSNQQHD